MVYQNTNTDRICERLQSRAGVGPRNGADTQYASAEIHERLSDALDFMGGLEEPLLATHFPEDETLDKPVVEFRIKGLANSLIGCYGQSIVVNQLLGGSYAPPLEG